MNTPTTVQVERINFEGNWSDICPHCGKIQKEHCVTNGPFDAVIYEHRMPCGPEKEKMHKEQRRLVQSTKVIVLIIWILVPLVYLLLQQFVQIVGWIAFGIALIQLSIVTIKHFGNPDRWIPGYKKKKEDDLKMSHYVYHCERNPEGLARLRAENFLRKEDDELKESKTGM
jgi:hypothetical protein